MSSKLLARPRRVPSTKPPALPLNGRDRHALASFENQLDRPVTLALEMRGQEDAQNQEHARGAERQRRRPRPALDQRDHAAGQDGRDI